MLLSRFFFDIRKQGFDDVGSKNNKYRKTYPILGKKIEDFKNKHNISTDSKLGVSEWAPVNGQ